MKRLLLTTVVLFPYLIGFAYGDDRNPSDGSAFTILEVWEERDGLKDRKLISGDWVEIRRDLVFVIPEGWFVLYQVIATTGAERRHGELPPKKEAGTKLPVKEITVPRDYAEPAEKWMPLPKEEPFSTSLGTEGITEPTEMLEAPGFESPMPTPWETTPKITDLRRRDDESMGLIISFEELEETVLKNHPEIKVYQNPDYIVIPVEEIICPDGRTIGFGKCGETIRFVAFEDSEEGEPVYRGKCEVEIIKKGLNLMTADSLNPTPLLIVELGKKHVEGESSTSFAPGVGVSYLFFYKHPEHQKLSNLGFGFNFSYSKTEIVKEGTLAAETANIGTFGGVLAYKPVYNLPLFFQAVGGINLTGDDRYGFVAFGIASPVDLKKLAAE